MRAWIAFFVGLCTYALAVRCVSAQSCAGELTLTPQHAVSGSIESIVPISSQEAIVKGTFQAFPRPDTLNIARMNIATGAMNPLSGMPSGFVRTIHPHPSGDVLVSGSFNGDALYRFSPSLGTWTVVGEPLFGLQPRHVVVLPNGDMLLSGTFAFDRLGQLYSMVRVSASTGQWTPEADGPLEIQSLTLVGNDVILAGRFRSIGGVAARSIARFDPVARTFTPLGGTLPEGITSFGAGAAVSLRNGEELLVATANGASRHALYRYVFATGVWTTSTARFARTISALTLLPSSGDVIVTGDFVTYDANTPVVFARYRPSLDFWFPITGWSHGNIRAAATLPGDDSQMLVAGEFSRAGLVAAYNIARYNVAQDQWSALSPQLDGPFYQLIATPRSTIIATRDYPHTGGDGRGPVIEYDPVSKTWTGWAIPNTPPFENGFRLGPVAVAANSDVLLSGTSGTSFSGTPFFVRRSATSGLWNPVLSSGALAGPVSTVYTRSNGDLIVQGKFLAPNSLGIVQATVLIDGNLGTWSPLSTGTGEFVFKLLDLPGGVVLAGGRLRSAGFLNTSGVALYRPSSGWSPIGLGIDGTVYDMIRLPSGDILLGGDFRFADGQDSHDLAILRADLETWEPLGNLFGSYTTQVLVLAQLPGGDVMVAGTFPNLPGVPGTRNIARFDPVSRTFASLGVDAPGPISEAVILPDGTIVFSGSGEAASGGGTSNFQYFAQFVPAASCQADFDCSRSVNGVDLLGFLDAWYASDPRVDLNSSGTVDVADIFNFLNVWFSGCP